MREPVRRHLLKRWRLARLRNRRQLLAGLAFVAMLLLLVMPTAGRLLGEITPGAYGMAHASAMAHGAPMTMPDQPPAIGHAGDAGHAGHPAAPDGNTPHPDHSRCPYCPLLGSIVAFSPCVTVAAALPDHHRAPSARHLAYAAVPHRGLGARGPPALL